MINSDLRILEVPTGISENASQKHRVYLTLIRNYGKWMTLGQIANLSGVRTESSVASRLRDLRADGYIVEKRLQKNNPSSIRVFEYLYP